MNLSDRKAFNFYRSYYDIALKLSPKDREKYLMAILKMQFDGEVLSGLSGMAEFAFISQKHSLNKQIEGYMHGVKGGAPLKGKGNHPPKGKGNQVQGQGEVQEKEKGEGKEELVILADIEIFSLFAKKYLGEKREIAIEFENFQKHTDWKEILPIIEKALDLKITERAGKKLNGIHVPEWISLEEWINNRGWEREKPKPNKEIFDNLQFELMNATNWIEEMARAKSLSIQKVKQHLKDFTDNLWLDEDYFKEIHEAKRHFRNWLQIQITKKDATNNLKGASSVSASVPKPVSRT